MQRRRRRVVRWIARQLRLAIFVALALTVFSATARAGTSYFVCSMTGEQRAEPCCEHRASPVPAVDKATCPCCESKLVHALPDFTLGVVPRIVTPLLIATRAITIELVRRAHVSFPVTRCAPSRAGPPLSPDRAQTRVFLI